MKYPANYTGTLTQAEDPYEMEDYYDYLKTLIQPGDNFKNERIMWEKLEERNEIDKLSHGY